MLRQDLAGGGKAGDVVNPCQWCHGTGVATLPSKRVPKHIREWRQVYPDVPLFMLVCDEHGKWFAEIDHLAPYHWEMSRCEDCR